MSHKSVLSILLVIGAGCSDQAQKQSTAQKQSGETHNEYYVDPALLTPFSEPLTTFVRRVEIDEKTWDKQHKYSYPREIVLKEADAYERELRNGLETAGYKLVDDEKKARIVVEYVYRTAGYEDTSNSLILWFFDLEDNCLIAKVNSYNHNLKKQQEIIALNSKKILSSNDLVKVLDRQQDLRMGKGKDGSLRLQCDSKRELTKWNLFRPTPSKSAKRVYLGLESPPATPASTLSDFSFEMDSVSFELAPYLLSSGFELTPRRQDAHIAIDAILHSEEFGDFIDSRLVKTGLKGAPGYHLKETIKIMSLHDQKVYYSGSFEGKTPNTVKTTTLGGARTELRNSFDAELATIKEAIKASSVLGK